MKNLLMLTLTIGTFSIFAQSNTLDLSPGSSATINASVETVVTCAGEEEKLPLCRIVPTTAPYTVYLGESGALSDHKTLDSAVKAINKLRSNKLCR